MEFTDLSFLFIFMPVLLLLYYLAKETYREVLLLIFSLFFYSCGSPKYAGLLLVSTGINMGLGCVLIKTREKQERKWLRIMVLALGILCNVSVLGYYKYANFLLTNLNRFVGTAFVPNHFLMPLGISFFTFKAVSFLVDAYRSIEEFHPVSAANYLSFFGQIQSGPIARYSVMEKGAKPGLDLFAGGTARFMLGFGKKILLANILSNITVEVFDNTQTLSTPLAWLGAVCYSLQLYYDFSGYSDMAIGICNMLGYECPENFHYPYMTASSAEFWRRWHMTLGSWFRDYIYIPMGGSRRGKRRLFINLFVVWFMTGLWHGSNWNFIVWGLGYFLMIALEKALSLPQRFQTGLGKTLWRIWTLFFINFQWVLFRCSSLSQGSAFLKIMCSATMDEIANARAAFLLRDYGAYIIIAVLFSMPLLPALENLCQKHAALRRLYDILYVLFVTAVFLMAVSFVISGQNSPFLYGNF